MDLRVNLTSLKSSWVVYDKNTVTVDYLQFRDEEIARCCGFSNVEESMIFGDLRKNSFLLEGPTTVFNFPRVLCIIKENKIYLTTNEIATPTKVALDNEEFTRLGNRIFDSLRLPNSLPEVASSVLNYVIKHLTDEVDLLDVEVKRKSAVIPMEKRIHILSSTTQEVMNVIEVFGQETIEHQIFKARVKQLKMSLEMKSFLLDMKSKEIDNAQLRDQRRIALLGFMLLLVIWNISMYVT